MGLAPCIDCKITINIWDKQKNPADFANYANYYPYRIKNSIICKTAGSTYKINYSNVYFNLIVSFDEFETHAGVMVRTFPETSLIILLVH